MNYHSNSRRNSPSQNEWVTILLYYVLPFIVVNSIIFFLVTSRPKCELTVGETNDYMTTTVSLKIKSILPIKNMSVVMDGEELELTALGKKEYTATVDKNGVVEVNLTSLNGMTAMTYEHINILDDAPPTINEPSVESGILSFKIDDSQSGVDYSSIYAVDSKGINQLPLSIDKTTATVTFQMDSDGLNLHAKDLSGNEVQATLKSHVEGSEEVVTSEGNGEETSETAETTE
ncbi:MAG: hypothetical protein ACLTKI_02295 [Lachnospiraceae bacterium]